MTSPPGIPPAPPTTARGEGRDALCDALMGIGARDGLDGVTFRSVAAEAGVTHGLASYHFGNRDTMIMEALLRAVREAIERTRLGEGAVSYTHLTLPTKRIV